MLNFIDRAIEKLFYKSLHRKRDRYVRKALEQFRKAHPEVNDQVMAELEKELDHEIDRVYAIADKSLLRAGIKRAKYIFWLSALLSVITVGVLSFLTGGLILPIIIPIITAFVAWAVTLATIPIGYEERIKGGIDSVIYPFEKKLSQKDEPNVANLQKNIENIQQSMNKLYQQFSDDHLCHHMTDEQQHEIERNFGVQIQELHLKIHDLMVKVDSIQAVVGEHELSHATGKSKMKRFSLHLFRFRHHEKKTKKQNEAVGISRYEALEGEGGVKSHRLSS